MADININTASAGYIATRQKMLDAWAAIKPFMIKYVKMSPEGQAAWRARDPFLAKFIGVCEAVVERHPERES